MLNKKIPEQIAPPWSWVIWDYRQSGKSGTIQESNQASGIRKAHCTKKLHFVSRNVIKVDLQCIYIRVLIPRTSTELAEAVPIGTILFAHCACFFPSE